MLESLRLLRDTTVDDHRVAEYCERINAATRAPELEHLTHRTFDPPAPWVADAILRALDQEPPLVELRVSAGSGDNWALAYEGPLLRRRGRRMTRATVYWTAPGKRSERFFAAEGAVGLAATARLALDYGHPLDTVELESHRGEVDGVAYDASGLGARPILAVEAKRDDVELRALMVGIEACRGTGGEDVHRQAIREAGINVRSGWPANHHKKCGFLVAYGPIGLWPVSSGMPDGVSGQIFIARPMGDQFNLETVPVGTLERAQLIEALSRVA